MRNVNLVTRRVGYGVADQALSSLTNFGVGFVVARALGTATFGAFSLAFATYLVILNLARAICSEPFVIRYSDASKDEWRRGTAMATGTALLIGIIGGVVCVIAGSLVGESLGTALIAMGITMPGLLLQDTWRYSFFAAGRTRSAFVNDLIWAMFLFPGLVVLSITDKGSVGTYSVMWGAAASVGGLAGIIQAGGILPQPLSVLRWTRGHRDLIPGLTGELMAMSGSRQAAFYAVGLVAGLEAVGAIRTAQIIFGPVYVVIMGLRSIAVPEAIRVLRRSSHAMQKLILGISSALAVGVMFYGLALMIIPSSWGEILLRNAWFPARQIIGPIMLYFVSFGAEMGALSGLRALAATRSSFRARITSGMLLLLCATAGASFGDTLFAAWGWTVGGTLGAVAWWWHLVREIRSRKLVKPNGK